jgi:protein N-terminal amidase
MDINPYKFKADFRDYEFATFHLRENTEVILCSMSWLKSEANGDEKDSIHSTIKYWAMRLLPLYYNAKEGRSTIFVACNRIGIERGSEFAGGSCVLDITSDRITLLDSLKRNSDVMIVEL